MKMCFRLLVRTVWLTLHQKDNWQSIKIRPEEPKYYDIHLKKHRHMSNLRCSASIRWPSVGSNMHCSGYIALWVKGNLLHCTGLHCNLIHWSAAVVRIALHKNLANLVCTGLPAPPTPSPSDAKLTRFLGEVIVFISANIPLYIC